MNKDIIIGTRGSELALWQANHVMSQLEQRGVKCTLKIIKTTGDEVQNLGFDKMEGKGFFTKEIEAALLSNEIDIAVHSHKDLETTNPEGLVVGAVSPRADARDLLLIDPEHSDSDAPLLLRANARVGTSSARRKSQMLHLRPDVQLADIRGNVPTRINKLRSGEFDAILLAKAGVDRLNIDLSDFVAYVLPPYDFVPAPAQGVLAIQCRADDHQVISLLETIDDKATREIIHIERTVLNKMDGGCQLPLGVYAEKIDGVYRAHVALSDTWDSPLNKFMEQHPDPGVLLELILQKISR